MSKPKKPSIFLRVRRDESASYAWLIEKRGDTRHGLTHGQMLHDTADRLMVWANALGITIEFEDLAACMRASCGNAATSAPSETAPTPGSSPAPSTKTDDPPAAGSVATALFS